jgi:YtcA family
MAPDFYVFGAFFPAWMLCGLIAIFAGIFFRIIFVASGLSNVLPFQLFVCTSIGVIAGTLAWSYWFGP